MPAEKSPYHEGERQFQKLVGEEEIADRAGQMISTQIPRGALPFIEKQRIVFLTSLDEDGRHWVTPLFGEQGFVKASCPDFIQLKTSSINTIPEENWEERISNNPEVGILFIDLETRKRLRVNGRFTKIQYGLFRLNVKEAYPNCPKHIQRRVIKPSSQADQNSNPAQSGEGPLDKELWQMILNADTFFVGSSNPNGGVDASHRGGNPGFIEQLNPSTLRIPDYSGNSLFNTMGNLHVHPKGGLLFWDLNTSKILQLTGSVEVTVNSENPADRHWDFMAETWKSTQLSFDLSEEFLDYSPYNP